jgi:tetratricopeptide (TPR) repeat protein
MLDLSDDEFEDHTRQIHHMYDDDDLRSGVKNINLKEIAPFHEAMVERAKKLGLTEDSILMRRNMASLYKVRGQKDDAIKELELACQEHPGSFDPIKDLSLLLEPQKALTLLKRKGFDKVLKSIDDKYFYAKALERAGDREEAQKIAQEIVDRLSLNSTFFESELRGAQNILKREKW